MGAPRVKVLSHSPGDTEGKGKPPTSHGWSLLGMLRGHPADRQGEGHQTAKPAPPQIQGWAGLDGLRRGAGARNLGQNIPKRQEGSVPMGNFTLK